MQGQGEQNCCQVFPVTIGSGSKGDRSRPALTLSISCLSRGSLIGSPSNSRDRKKSPSVLSLPSRAMPVDAMNDDSGRFSRDLSACRDRSPGRATSLTARLRSVLAGRPSVNVCAGSGDPSTTGAGSGDPCTTVPLFVGPAGAGCGSSVR